MAKSCVCGAVQTGHHKCIDTPKQLTGIVLVKLIADDGTRNYIDPATFTASTIETNVNNLDLSKRWYVFDDVHEVARTPVENPSITTKAGVTKNVKDLKMFQFEGTVFSVPTAQVGDFKKAFCQGYGVYYIFEGKIVQGNYNTTDGYLYPRELDGDSLDFVPAGDSGGTDMGGVDITFFEAQDEDIANIGQIILDLSGKQALVAVIGFDVTEISTSTGVIKVKGVFPYGSLNDVIYLTDTVVGDWTITSTGGTVSVDSVTVTDNAGVCEIDIAWSGSAVATDDYTLQYAKNGYYAKAITGTLA